MGLRRHLKKLLNKVEQDDQSIAEFTLPGFAEAELHYTTEIPWPSMWAFAKFAYIAEQYGYRYGGLNPDKVGTGRPFFIFRRLPDARLRAEQTHARFPKALSGGQLPGMRPWRFPVPPQPEARREVKLLHARIKVDYFSVLGRQRLKPWFIAIGVVSLALIVVNGQFNSAGALFAAGAAVTLSALLVTSRMFMRRRLMAYQRMLDQAGITWPPGCHPDIRQS